MSQKWDERYKRTDFAYGTEPNVFFREWLPAFTPGSILMPADGEGRNGIFAAQTGWKVTSCDFSTEARSKAMLLAREKQVALEYLVGDFSQLSFQPASFDAIGLIYAHLDIPDKSVFHRQLNGYLRPGGIIILEAFSKQHLHYKQLNPGVGGPGDLQSLYSKTEITADFHNYDILLLEEEVIFLQEGSFHVGEGAVVRFVGRKRGDDVTR
ncbi:class I SAM-dependent methyltransferase [Chitinophaga sp. Mgbs1]|uniref:Class I SAM-dependent methyltransferase n=1 Tax=Chitinophaga solisilvae TaxID=1233460 RepID=A0A433WKT5_9BACT|nr:class I SAM-dependent methyltransferase [Chitinophaga solisilvae]